MKKRFTVLNNWKPILIWDIFKKTLDANKYSLSIFPSKYFALSCTFKSKPLHNFEVPNHKKNLPHSLLEFLSKHQSIRYNLTQVRILSRCEFKGFIKSKKVFTSINFLLYFATLQPAVPHRTNQNFRKLPLEKLHIW